MPLAWLLFVLPVAVVAAFQENCIGQFFSPSCPTTRHPNYKSNQVNRRTIRNMFTGIVEEMGTVVSLIERDDMPLWDGSTGKGTELTVQGNVVMDGAYLGYDTKRNGWCNRRK